MQLRIAWAKSKLSFTWTKWFLYEHVHDVLYSLLSFFFGLFGLFCSGETGEKQLIANVVLDFGIHGIPSSKYCGIKYYPTFRMGPK